MKRLGALPEKDDRDQRTLFIEGIPKTPLGTSRPVPSLHPLPPPSVTHTSAQPTNTPPFSLLLYQRATRR